MKSSTTLQPTPTPFLRKRYTAPSKRRRRQENPPSFSFSPPGVRGARETAGGFSHSEKRNFFLDPRSRRRRRRGGRERRRRNGDEMVSLIYVTALLNKASASYLAKRGGEIETATHYSLFFSSSGSAGREDIRTLQHIDLKMESFWRFPPAFPSPRYAATQTLNKQGGDTRGEGKTQQLAVVPSLLPVPPPPVFSAKRIPILLQRRNPFRLIQKE